LKSTQDNHHNKIHNKIHGKLPCICVVDSQHKHNRYIVGIVALKRDWFWTRLPRASCNLWMMDTKVCRYDSTNPNDFILFLFYLEYNNSFFEPCFLCVKLWTMQVYIVIDVRKKCICERPFNKTILNLQKYTWSLTTSTEHCSVLEAYSIFVNSGSVVLTDSMH